MQPAALHPTLDASFTILIFEKKGSKIVHMLIYQVCIQEFAFAVAFLWLVANLSIIVGVFLAASPLS